MIERSEIVCFKLKSEEKEQLREAAAHRGITLSEVIRDALLQDDALRWSHLQQMSDQIGQRAPFLISALLKSLSQLPVCLEGD